MKNLILGVDPGLKGGIAVLNTESNKLELLQPMPLASGAKHFTTTGPRIDAKAIHALIQGLSPKIALAVIEDVSSRPGQGVVSMFSFGYGYGLVCGVLTTFDFELMRIKPAVWKAQMNLSSDKTESLRMAAELWPEHCKIFNLKKNDGMAEAAILARFALTAMYSGR